ncbi:hypothetical protein EDB84DRAFT_1435976 [Lactarius hengduanensis]|nr:hypothetical protein EDB84DRAFT_1435976 [Lactarius hengduanensis]
MRSGILRHSTPTALHTSIPLAHLPQHQHQEQDPIPTSPAHFPGIQALHPEPATTLPQCAWPEEVDWRGEGDTNINGSRDDFGSRLDMCMWNHTGALPCFLSFVHASACTSSSSSCTPTLAVSLTYLPAITLLASLLLISVAIVTWLCGLSPPCITPVQKQHIAITAKTTVAGIRVIMTTTTATATTTGDNNGDKATATTATTATRQL